MEDQDKTNAPADFEPVTPATGSGESAPSAPAASDASQPSAEPSASNETPNPSSGTNEPPATTGSDVPAPVTGPIAPATPDQPAVSMSVPPPTPSYSGAPVAETNTLAIVSLVASILAWVGLFGVGGIVGVIVGIMARNQIRESAGRQTGDGIAVAGIVLGGINIIFACIAILCVFAAILGMITIPFIGGNGR